MHAHLVGMLYRCKMPLVFHGLNKKSIPIRKINIVFWVPHFHVLCSKFAIHHKLQPILPSSVICISTVYTTLRNSPHRSGSLDQSPGRFNVGCGQAAHHKAICPFLPFLYPSCEMPCCIRRLRNLHCLATRRSSL